MLMDPHSGQQGDQYFKYIAVTVANLLKALKCVNYDFGVLVLGLFLVITTRVL